MGEGINPAFYARVIIEHVAVEVAELKGVPFESRALERFDYIGFDEGSASEGHKALKTLYEEDNVFVIYVFPY